MALHTRISYSSNTMQFSFFVLSQYLIKISTTIIYSDRYFIILLRTLIQIYIPNTQHFNILILVISHYMSSVDAAALYVGSK
jgi:hypothetical protein